MNFEDIDRFLRQADARPRVDVKILSDFEKGVLKTPDKPSIAPTFDANAGKESLWKARIARKATKKKSLKLAKFASWDTPPTPTAMVSKPEDIPEITGHLSELLQQLYPRGTVLEFPIVGNQTAKFRLK